MWHGDALFATFLCGMNAAWGRFVCHILWHGDALFATFPPAAPDAGNPGELNPAVRVYISV
jgi:hypothetical protein